MSRDQFFSSVPDAGTAPQTFDLVIDASGQTSIVVDQGAFLLTAEYVRSGPDLVLVGADGTRVLITGYFDAEVPADLLTLKGALVTGETAALLAGPVADGFAQVSGSLGAPIGLVENADGAVFASRVDGSRVQLNEGDPVYQDDVIQTDGDGSVGLRFNDDTTFSIGEDARMVLDDFVFDPSAGSGNAVINVLQGSFSFVSGAVAQTGDDALTVKTPVLTIGVRGTFVTGRGGQEGETTEVVNLPDDNGEVGSIFASNDAGGVLLDDAFEGTQTDSRFSAPSTPRVYQQNEIEDRFGNALDLLPSSPGVQNRGNNRDDGSDGSRDDGGAGVTDDGDGGADDEAEESAEIDGTEEEGAEDEATEGDEEGAEDGEDAEAADGSSTGEAGTTAFRVTEALDSDGFSSDPTALTAFERANQEALRDATGADDESADDEPAENPTVDESLADDPSEDDEVVVAENAEEESEDEGEGEGEETGQNIEGGEGDDSLDGGGQGDTINGGAGNDSLNGGGGGDIVSGGAGNDSLDGGEGDDTLNGGQGADTLIGGEGTGDTADFSGTVGRVTLNLGEGTATDGFGDNDVINGIENVLGSGFDDDLTGSSDANNITGGGGNDSIAGAAGDDIIDGGAGNDNLSGGDGADSLTGGAGGDTLTGGAGADTLVGGDGDDLYIVDDVVDIGVIESGVPEGAAAATAGPSPATVRSAQVGDDVFLEGDFLSVGVSGSGSFGTDNNAPAGFNTAVNETQVGMSIDQDGFGVGDAPNTADFFLPGSPEESFTVGYRRGGAEFNFTNSERVGEIELTQQNVENQSSGDRLAALWEGVTNGDSGRLEVDQTVSFNESDKFFQTTITLKNVGAETLQDVRYMRSFDPDQESGVSGGAGARTRNDVISQPGDGGNDNLAIVSATGLNTDVPIFFLADDARARVASNSFFNRDVFVDVLHDEPQAEGFQETADRAIVINFDVGALDAGETATLTFFTSLDQNLEASIEAITGGDDTIIEGADGGTDTIQSDIGIALPDNVENLQLVGDNNVDGVGNDLDNRIDGNASANIIQGEGGNDTINGASGNDVLFGGAGDDLITGGLGRDNMTGGAGGDTFFVVSANDGASIAANQTVAEAGVAVDLVSDFQSGVDEFVFDATSGDFTTVSLVTIGESYDGTNSGLSVGETFVFDGKHLIHDSDVNSAGYTVVAEVRGDDVAAGDIKLEAA